MSNLHRHKPTLIDKFYILIQTLLSDDSPSSFITNVFFGNTGQATREAQLLTLYFMVIFQILLMTLDYSQYKLAKVTFDRTTEILQYAL